MPGIDFKTIQWGWGSKNETILALRGEGAQAIDDNMEVQYYLL